MEFKLSPTEEAFRDGLSAWLEAHCPRDWEKTRQALGSPEARAPELANAIGLDMAGPAIMVHGTEGQKRFHLPRILAAE